MSERLSCNDNPCLDCGACCATYRVSFYWAEAEVRSLPAHLTDKVNDWYSCMAGTGRPSPRCVALQGSIGGAVACAVYDSRPSPCRELQPGEEKCNKARLRHGLPSVSPEPADQTANRPRAPHPVPA
ncbi:MAG TPA: YkgJ family cysteine cluster protein [Noviherbaspirillum sp.]|uniref:YkgJ family cysteine cluster protein n=1 Tax=Noviherbaspirillum sp. TaxID=1926288 RepID=UPI002D5E9450|nr:YkgJ family cysteine cluster protein [Noviherbaspirillum sp.]HYD94170.1 YkgJ family cysteine cluster protein [Noviherbaspirillum sp.]